MAERESVMVVIQNQLEAMSPRDRRMLAVLACFGALVVGGLTSWLLMGALDDKAARVVQQKDALEVIQAMAEEHQQSLAVIEQGEARLKRYEGQRFKPFVEQEAARLGLELGTINDQGSEVVGTIKQTIYKVELKKLDLQRSVDFLYVLETSGYPLQIQNARFKTQVSTDKTLTVTLEVLAFALVEGE
jgi:type II secretory pathway component PulM